VRWSPVSTEAGAAMNALLSRQYAGKIVLET
jgi:hypothetical protein